MDEKLMRADGWRPGLTEVELWELANALYTAYYGGGAYGGHYDRIGAGVRDWLANEFDEADEPVDLDTLVAWYRDYVWSDRRDRAMVAEVYG